LVKLLLHTAFAAIVGAILTCAFFSPLVRGHQHVGAPVPLSLDATPTIDRESSAIPDSEPKTDADGSVDLYGNDVTDAVAKYSLDATGSLYEVHSPQTEIPRLGSPKS
jgi:hypothetical protein